MFGRTNIHPVKNMLNAKTNATEKYGEDLEKKKKVNGQGERKLRQGTKHTWLYSDRAFKGKHSSALGF